MELGVWQGSYQNMEGQWLRWWDAEGSLLLTGAELAEQERWDKEEAQRQAEQAERRAERLAERLRSLGLEPEEG